MLTDKKQLTPVCPENIPDELKALRQWVLWRAEPRKGQLSKVPYQIGNGQTAQTNNPATWGEFSRAIAAYSARQGDGIGFVFAHGGGLCGVDLDDCFTEGGELHPKAAAIVRALNSYTEYSVSGRGLHVLVRATLDGGKRFGPLEIYPHGRYFTMTGHVYGDLRQIRDAQEEIERLIAPPSPPSPPQRRTMDTGGGYLCRGGYLCNSELIEKAKAARNGTKFSSLWAGDISGYSSQSEADIALMCLLLFWTHDDADRAEVLFRQSGLYREKWDRADYRRRTIQATSDCLSKEGGAGYGR